MVDYSLGAMVIDQDKQTIMNESDSHKVLHDSDFVPN